jgi:hypothetical protein
MDDDLRKLEQALRAKAAEVPYVQDVPPTLLRRARGRIARNAVTSVVAVALIVGGASAALAGIGALGRPDHSIPGSSGAPTVAPAASCAAVDLRADGALDGAAGSVVGSIDLTNLGTTTCTLTGRSTLTLTSGGHDLVPTVSEVPAQWQVDGVRAPQAWPVVTLTPGAKASIRVRWSNACPQLSSPVVWHVDLGGTAGGLDATGTEATPPCLGGGEPSTLEVGPFEPQIGG